MKLLTKRTDYAVRALIYLTGEKDQYVSARKVSKEEKIPYEYLRKIFRDLIRADLVRSSEGGKGGYALAVDPYKIKITDLITLFQGEIKLSECLFRKKICQNRATCVLRNKIKDIEDLVKNEFEALSIGGLYSEAKKRG